MNLERLDDILSRFRTLTICVLGDFYLDRFLDIEAGQTAPNAEAGPEAYQVTQVRCEAGAAGAVVTNLCALGVGAVRVISCIGVDGEGFELARVLARVGAETSALLESSRMRTPTFVRPLVRPADGPPKPLHRLDIHNRQPLAEETESELLRELRACLAEAGAVMVVDYVAEPNWGIITERMRENLCEIAAARPETIFFAQSTARVGEFQNMATKPSLREAARAVGRPDTGTPEPMELALALRQRTHAAVYLALDADGLMLADEGGARLIPGFPAEAVVDPVGAQDAAAAAITASLCAGASPEEAGIIGNLAASVAIEQVGAAARVTPKQLRRRLETSARKT